MPGWESRLGQQHRMCLLLKCPTHRPLGHVLSAESLSYRPTNTHLEQNNGVLAGSWQCKYGFWCSEAQIVLKQLPQAEEPFISPLFSFFLEDRRVETLIFAFCFFTGASSNEDCPWDNGPLIIFSCNVLNWAIFPQINYLCPRNRAVFYSAPSAVLRCGITAQSK